MSNRREFIKQAGMATIGLGILQLLPKWIIAATKENSFILPRSTPELQGISSSGIMKFLDAVKNIKQEFHSLMILL